MTDRLLFNCAEEQKRPPQVRPYNRQTVECILGIDAMVFGQLPVCIDGPFDEVSPTRLGEVLDREEKEQLVSRNYISSSI